MKCVTSLRVQSHVRAWSHIILATSLQCGSSVVLGQQYFEGQRCKGLQVFRSHGALYPVFARWYVVRASRRRFFDKCRNGFREILRMDILRIRYAFVARSRTIHSFDHLPIVASIRTVARANVTLGIRERMESTTIV